MNGCVVVTACGWRRRGQMLRSHYFKMYNESEYVIFKHTLPYRQGTRNRNIQPSLSLTTTMAVTCNTELLLSWLNSMLRDISFCSPSPFCYHNFLKSYTLRFTPQVETRPYKLTLKTLQIVTLTFEKHILSSLSSKSDNGR